MGEGRYSVAPGRHQCNAWMLKRTIMYGVVQIGLPSQARKPCAPQKLYPLTKCIDLGAGSDVCCKKANYEVIIPLNVRTFASLNQDIRGF